MTENTQPEATEPTSYKKELIIGTIVVVAVIGIIAAIWLQIYNSTPKIDYQPTAACSTFTDAEAQELLGKSAFNTTSDNPIQSVNTATSRCGYADGNSDTEKIIVAAIIMRSGLNDKGVEQNKTEFAKGTPTQGFEVVKDLGDSAYFNQSNGQLNVLDGRNWFIFSYGIGSTPETNSVEDAVKFAQKVLN